MHSFPISLRSRSVDGMICFILFFCVITRQRKCGQRRCNSFFPVCDLLRSVLGWRIHFLRLFNVFYVLSPFLLLSPKQWLSCIVIRSICSEPGSLCQQDNSSKFWQLFSMSTYLCLGFSFWNSHHLGVNYAFGTDEWDDHGIVNIDNEIVMIYDWRLI